MSNLIIIDITETEEIKVDHFGNLKEIKGAGYLSIKNPSNNSKLWDLNCDLKENVNTTIDSREINLEVLNPSQEFKKSYQIQNLKSPSLMISETFDIHNNNKRGIKIKISNLLENSISDIKIRREIPENFQDIDIEPPIIGEKRIKKVSGIKMFEWDILSLEGKQTAELLIQCKDQQSLGPLNVSYSINNYKLTRLNPEIRSSTDVLSKIKKKKGAIKGFWDCEVEFLNTSEFQVKLENLKVVYKKINEIKTVVSQTPNKILNPEQSWIHPFKIESNKTPELNISVEFFPLFTVITRVLGEIQEESISYNNRFKT